MKICLKSLLSFFALIIILFSPLDLRAQDSDGDGMDDGWEIYHWCLDSGTPDGHIDHDSDGMTSLEEFQHNVDLLPCNPDSDDDGMEDGWEVNTGGACLNPLYGDSLGDPDSDFLTSMEEYILGTDPCVANDEDGDGMPDWWEAIYGCVGGTTPDWSVDWDGDGFNNLQEYTDDRDPCVFDDADADGMPDGWEDSYACVITSTADGHLDQDGDHLSSFEEYSGGGNPCVITDSDGDGMSDYWEDQYACVNSLVGDSLTDPDSDLLTSISEYSNGGNPCVADTDGDGSRDDADCDPENGEVYPGARELCDRVDNQCPGDPGFGNVDDSCFCNTKDTAHSVAIGEGNPAALAAFEDGGYVVAWEYYDRIYASRYNQSGSPQGGEIMVYDGNSSHSPSVAADSSNNFIVAWEESGDIYARRYNSSGVAQGNEFQVDQGAGGDRQTDPDIATDSTNKFIVTWVDENNGSGSGEHIFARRYDSAGNPLGGQFSVDSGSNISVTAQPPAIAVDSNDNFIIAWSFSDRTLFLRRFSSAGGPLGTQVLVHDWTSIEAHVDIAVAGNDSFMITWNSYYVYARLFDASGHALGERITVGITGSSAAGKPSIASFRGNSFVVGWHEEDASDNADRIYMRRYDHLGNPLGDAYAFEYRWQSYIDSRYPTLAANRFGDVVHLWNENNGMNVRVWEEDTDCDGLFDSIEESSVCLSFYDADTDDDMLCDGNVEFTGVCDIGEDMDLDAVMDAGETDPCDPDTDSDGMDDYWEYLNVSCVNSLVDDSAFDPDLDHTPNLIEYQNLTDPCAVADSDGDGMVDDWENAYACVQYNVADGHLDPDGDGVTSLVEYGNSTDPCTTSDTDGDGLSDEWELIHSCLMANTADSAVDHDSDGMTSLSEYSYSDWMDPCDPDTDGDLVSDGDEVGYGSNPLDDRVASNVFKDGNDVRVTNDGAGSMYAKITWIVNESMYGVGWLDNREGSAEVYFKRVGLSGNTVEAATRVSPLGDNSGDVAITYTGSEVGLTYWDWRTGLLEVYLARLNEQGVVQDTGALISDTPAHSVTSSITWSGTEYGVVWDDARDGSWQVYFTRASSTGSTVGPNIRLSHSAGFSAYPVIAWTGSEYGVAWYDNRDGPYDIYFSRIAADGTTVGIETKVADCDDCGLPSITWSGSEFGLAYNDGRSGDPEIYFLRLGQDGTTVMPELRVTNSAGNSDKPWLEWTSTGYAISWHDDRAGRNEVYLAMVTPSGRKLGVNLAVTAADGATSEDTCLVDNSQGLGVSWHDYRDGNTEIYLASLVIDTDGDGLGPEAETVAGTDPADWDSDDDGFSDGDEVNLFGTNPLVADADADSDGLPDAVETNTGVYVDPTDTGTDPADQDTDGDGAGDYEEVMNGSNPFMDDITPGFIPDVGGGTSIYAPAGEEPSLAWSGSEFGIAWNHRVDLINEIFFSRFSEDGNPIGSPLRVTYAAATSEAPSLVWTGSEYAISWVDARDGNYEIYFSRVSAQGNEIGDDTRLTFDPDFSSDPSMVCTGSEFGVAWQDEREVYSDVFFTRVSAGGTEIGDDTRMSFSTMSIPSSLFVMLEWTGSEYGLSWSQAVSWSNTDIHFTRISADGTRSPGTYHTGTLYNDYLRSLEWTGDEFGIGFSSASLSRISVGRISAFGSPIGENTMLMPKTYNINMEWADGFYGVIRRQQSPARVFYLMDTDGAGFSDEIDMDLITAYPEMVWTGSDFGACWTANNSVNLLLIRRDSDGDGLADADEATYSADAGGWDSDGDGMPDGWEVASGSCGLDPAVGDSLGDPDIDGYANLYEYSIGTDPCVPNDTDGDGMNDYWESLYGCLMGLTPDGDLDPDGDDVSSLIEYGNSTDPCVSVDNDGDGMPDHWEDNLACVSSLVNDASLDGDGDGLSNIGEYTAGTDPCVTDSDMDGFIDGSDCAPADPLVHPGAQEICDGLDNQCPGDPGYGYLDAGCACGGTSDAPIQVRDNTDNPTGPAVAIVGQSNFVITWHDWRGTGYDSIYAKIFNFDGDSLGPDFKVSSVSAPYHNRYPAIAVDKDNNFIIAWESNDLPWAFIKAIRYDMDGDVVNPEFQVESGWTGGSYEAYRPAVATASNNGFVVTWEEYRDGYEWVVVARRFKPDGTPAGLQFELEEPFSGAEGRYPDVAIDSKDNMIFTWARDNPYVIALRRFTSTGIAKDYEPWIYDPGVGQRTNPSIATDSDDNFIITWQEDINGDWDIYAQRFDPDGNTVGPHFRVDDGGTADAQSPSIAIDPENNFIIAWADERGGIYARRFNSNGDAMGSGFLIGAAAISSTLDVVSDDTSRFIVTWDWQGIYAYYPRTDADCDGVKDKYEIAAGCMDPIDPDTDRDGLCDGSASVSDGPVVTCLSGEDMNDDGFRNPEESDPCDIDTDGDGFSDSYEVYTLNTDPVLVDSDGDGLTDDTEVNVYGSNPVLADTDGDNLSDYDELMNYLTDPFDNDSDGDGLSDFTETYVTGTDPLLEDSDSDGIIDGEEEGIGVGDPDGDAIPNSWESSYPCMDPYSNDAAGDYDNDGRSNLFEFRLGTDPCNPDTDGDGLCDRWIAVGSTCFDGEQNYGTDSQNPDTDGDGLIDGDEVSVHSTDPLDADSDNDTFSDGAEIAAGTNPNDPGSFPTPPAHLINYQGRLTDGSGVSVGDTTLSMTFSVFDGETGGVPLWNETQTVSVVSGIYHVLLGSQTALDTSIFSSPVLYLEVEVEGEILSPRARLTSVPFAINSDRLSGTRLEMQTRTLAISTPSSSVVIHVSFDQAFTSPPQVMVSPPAGPIGGQDFIATSISNITSEGFEVTFKTLSGDASAGSGSFTYWAFGN
jgi:hypothetical protein